MTGKIDDKGDRETLVYGMPAFVPLKKVSSEKVSPSGPEPSTGAMSEPGVPVPQNDLRNALLSRGEIFIPNRGADVIAFARQVVWNKYIMECETGAQQDRVEEIVHSLRGDAFEVVINNDGSVLVKIRAGVLERLNAVFLQRSDGVDSGW